MCVCSGSIFYAHYGHFSWSVIGKTMTSSGSCFFSSHYSIMLEQPPSPYSSLLGSIAYHALSPWAGDRTRISLLRLFCDHFSFRLSSWPSHTHTHTNTRTAVWGGYAYTYMRYLCGRMWACVCVCHLCSRINKCLRRELNFLLPHPEVCTKVNVPLAAPPRRDGRTLRICLSACQIACEIFSKYIYTLTHTPSTPTHFVQLNYFIRKERFFIVFFILLKSLLRFIA